MIEKKLEKIKNETILKIENSESIKQLEEIKVGILGKKGELTSILKSLGSLSNEERPKVGKIVNMTRGNLEKLLNNKREMLKEEALKNSLIEETIDVTMKGKAPKLGKVHPMTSVIDEINTIFLGMGYETADGPEIEKEYYNFNALNIEENHPARDEQDTFYLGNGFLLRTQTSPVQIRKMEEGKLPIKIISPGRVFRADEVDATHSPSFHQVEGLVIDENISMAYLKGTLEAFAKELLGEKTKVKFRPHHFPFTEPSAEMDVTCFVCNGVGCKVCKYEGWIELLGCGMVHPKVLEMSGIDSKKYSGFAFGMGLERLAMLKYEIKDLRLMYENNVNFLKQF